MSQTVDFVRALNNYLQGHSTGNLSSRLSWNTWQEGPQHQVTHHAIANFRGHQIGYGTGVAKGLAKAQAAEEALEYLRQTLST